MQTTLGQTTTNIIPPSPNAASLGRYGEIPISLYTGTPSISIPIWEIKEGDITVPISFSYNASGVKVEETASWVGLGWSLNAGGVITRSVRGKPDEEGYYHPSNPKLPNLLLNQQISAQNQCEILDAAQFCKKSVDGEGYFDSEPDLFFFNFNGIQGKFIFDQDGMPYTIPYQKIRIERNKTLGSTTYKWVITTVDGTKYKFIDSESTTAFSIKYGFSGNLNFIEYDEFTSQINQSQESSWYLKEIESTTGRKVTFSYVDENSENNSGVSERRAYQLAGSIELTQHRLISGVKTKVLGKRLSEITFSNGSVSFIANKNREDLGYLQNDYPKALDKITIKDKNAVPIKNFVLNTDYFLSGGSNIAYFNKRLKLVSITEFSGDMTKNLPPNQFFYEEDKALPPRDATSQDHWGYYNGKINKDYNGLPTLIPSFTKAKSVHFSYLCDNSDPVNNMVSAPDCFGRIISTDFTTQPLIFSFQGADRSFDLDFAKTGLLKKIVYPTGGYTTFEFEAHDYELAEYVKKEIASQFFEVGSNCAVPQYNGLPILRNLDNGGSCYQKLQFIPINSIPADARSLNPTISFDFSSFVEVNGFNYTCCDNCYQPEGTFTDVTTNKVLIKFGGLTSIVYDNSILSQINNGIANITTNTNGSSYTPPPVPYWVINNLQLDPSHTYEIQTQTQDCQACNSQPNCTTGVPRLGAYIRCNFRYKTNEIAEYNGVMGGMRIKKITSFNKEGDTKPLIKKYIYQLSGSDNKISSGVINDIPVYFDVNSVTTLAILYVPFSGQNLFLTTSQNDYKTVVSLTSGSKFELGQTNGSFIGYREVQELICQDSDCLNTPMGKKISTYTSAQDYQDINSQTMGVIQYNNSIPSNCDYAKIFKPLNLNPFANYYPYAPKNSFDWKRGLLKNETVLDSQNKIKRKVEFQYNLLGEPNNRKVIFGLKIARSPLYEKSQINVGSQTVVWNTEFFYSRYDMIVEWNYTTQQMTTEYDDNGKSFVTTTDYKYDNPIHAQLTRTINSTSDASKKVITQLTYPLDYSNTGDAIINDMKSDNRFMHNSIIQKTVLQENGGIQKVLNSQITKYDFFTGEAGKTNVLPKEIVSTESSRPLDPTNSSEFPTYIPSNGYDVTKFKKKITFDSYDARGNIAQFHKENDVNSVYLWGYNSTYPIAEIKNATISQVLGAMGISSDDLENYASSLSPSQTYLTKISSLRANFTLKNSFITTYTYKPLVGMLTSTDPSGRITYYEYDEFHRLKFVKDQDGNIVKQYRYQYAR